MLGLWIWSVFFFFFLWLPGLVTTTHPDTVRTQARTAMYIHAWSQMSISDSQAIYHDNMPERITFAPPEHLLPDPPGEVILHIARVSDTILNGEWWFAGQMGYLDAVYTYQVLDANISVHVKYGNLEFGIPTDDLMTLHVDTGIVVGSCNNVDDEWTNNRPMFAFHFENANGLGTASYNAHQGAVAMKVTEWQLNQTSIILDYPPVFLPEEFISDMLRHIVNTSTDAANAFLYDHPYVLPPGFRAKVPNPYVHLRHQSGCCGNIHGYVEITSTVPAGSFNDISSTRVRPLDPPRTMSIGGVVVEPVRLDATRATRADDTGGSLHATVYQHSNVGQQTGCHVNDVGAVAAMLSLKSTAGLCKPLPLDLSMALFGTDITKSGSGLVFNYALSMLSDGSIRLQLMCYSSDPQTGLCDLCTFDTNTTQDWAGSCIAPMAQQQKQSSLYLQPSTSQCMGSSEALHPGVFWMGQYMKSTSCAIIDPYGCVCSSVHVI
jgi:hypothetical protein